MACVGRYYASTMPSFNPLSLPLPRLAVSLFLLSYPAVAILVHGGASRGSVIASVVSLAFLAYLHRQMEASWEPIDRRLCLALGTPLAVVIVVELLQQAPILSTFDTPARFLIVAPLVLALRRCPLHTLAWTDLSFTLGAWGAFGVAFFTPREWGLQRVGSNFMNPIHFGDMSLLFGILSALSIDWWRRDSNAVRIFKFLGFCAGCFASLQSGTRGGWLAVPIIAMLCLYVANDARIRRLCGLMMGLVVISMTAFVLIFGLHGRLNAISADIDAYYRHGYKDTSTGIRVQLYQAGFELIKQKPLLGWGGDGFREAMQPMADSGRITPTAAELGRAEAHNQLLLFFVNYGIFGALALLVVFIVPGYIFARALDAQLAHVRRAGLMGLALVFAFFVFGMTVEILNLKMTISIYVTSLAMLLAVATHLPSSAQSVSSR